jgi:tetratricopeptide (TPR) repeat protein
VAECPHCGSEVGAEDAFCKHCGGKLSAAKKPSATMEALAAEFQRKVDDHPNDADARYSLGVALFYNEHWAQAAAHLERVIDLSPNFADAYARLVVCLARLGRAEEAMAVAEKGVAVAPDHEDLARLKQELEDLGAGHA